MDAGREMDALVAEKVMGFTLDYEFEQITNAPNVKELRSSDDEWGILPNYSTDIADAWAVVNHFVGTDGREQDFFIECWSDGEWFVAFHPAGYQSRDPKANCDGRETGKPSAPLAICRAALKSVGVEA